MHPLSPPTRFVVMTNLWGNRVLIHILKKCEKVNLKKLLKQIYWSKFLTDHRGLCRFCRKHKIAKKSENSDNKTGDYSSFKFTKMFFQKKSLCIFFGQTNGKYPTQIRAFNFTTVDYHVYWTFKITLSFIGFQWIKVLIC